MPWRDEVAPVHKDARSYDLFASSKDGNLLKRRLGEKIHLDLRGELRALPDGGILFLDIRRVKFATSSCLNEILRVFDESKSPEFNSKFVLLRANFRNEELIDCLNYVIKDKGIVVPAIDEEDNWQLIGDLSKALRDTLEFVREKTGVTSTQVSSYFEIPLSAASNRLKQLYEMKLTRREEETVSESGGRQFVYQALGD